MLANIDRRAFIVGSGGLLWAGAAPSDQLVLGVIGSGGRGTAVMKVFQSHSDVKIGAICDVYEPNLEQALAEAVRGGSHPISYRNYRDLLADKNIQAVLIATPEHWHYQMVMDAIAAGKDIYVEKPLCRTPEEGVTLVNAEKNSRCVIQVGMQRRSYDLFLNARRIVASGSLGQIRMVRSWWLNNSLNTAPATQLEGKLDWEQWQGPAEHRPFDPDRFRNWREYSEYSGGIVADQGAHVFDGIHLLMNAGYPLAVNSSAGRVHKQRVDTPESQVVIAEYPEDFLAVFTINYAAMHYKPQNDQLNQLDGDQARLDIGREDFKVYRRGNEERPETAQHSELGFSHATDLHVANFLECVRTRQTPTAPVRLGFQAALVVQMANLSLRQGRRLRWNAQTNQVEA
ncbi:MAG: Gfo/Idh/MocA family oxidoreductase [Bryobacteraceae bacterium]